MEINTLRSELIALGIRAGDCLLISSDTNRILYEAISNDTSKYSDQIESYNLVLNQIIDLLQKLVGEEGTLLFPVYNWDFCKGKTFNYKKTKGKTGVLGNLALERKDFKRTMHPLYSFAVWGRDTETLVALNNESAFGNDSPFAYLHKKGKMLGLDVDCLHSFTFVHYVEECNQIKYRYLKEFTAPYVDEKDTLTARTYSMCVRDLKIGAEFDFDDEILKENKAIRIFENSEIYLVLVDLERAYDAITNEIRYNGAKRIHTIKKNSEK